MVLKELHTRKRSRDRRDPLADHLAAMPEPLSFLLQNSKHMLSKLMAQFLKEQEQPAKLPPGRNGVCFSCPPLAVGMAARVPLLGRTTLAAGRRGDRSTRNADLEWPPQCALRGEKRWVWLFLRESRYIVVSSGTRHVRCVLMHKLTLPSLSTAVALDPEGELEVKLDVGLLPAGERLILGVSSRCTHHTRDNFLSSSISATALSLCSRRGLFCPIAAHCSHLS